jgi:Helicase HerA, central domain
MAACRLSMQLTIGKTLTKFGDASFSIDLDRGQFRHGWLLGKSGTGKSTLLRNIIVAAMRAKMGIVVIDPHGDLVYDVFNYIPPERLEDVLFIDPENERAPDLGIFDYPDKEKAVQAFLSLMEAHAGPGWGPETAHILRCCADAVLELVKNATILHIYLLLVRPDYAKDLLAKSKNPLVQDFYRQYYEDLKPQERTRNFSHPLNKIEELMRPGLVEFLSQNRHMSFTSLMDKQKILLCRIPKGLIGERPAKVLGSLILSKINLASFRRKKRTKQILVVVDEIHNFTDGIDFEAMLAEGRKFGIHYLFATQTTEQMRDERRGIYNDRIAFGNTSHIFSFRVSGDDSERIALNFGEGNFAPGLVRLPNYRFAAWSMEDNSPIFTSPVALDQYPQDSLTVPTFSAIAQARDNTGRPKEEIQKGITKILGR